MNDTPTPDRLEAIARTVHTALRGWAMAHGQTDIPDWDDAPDWMHSSTRESVLAVLEDRQMDGRAQHEQWMEQKLRDGWRYGAVKDASLKTHPLLVAWDALPEWERRKDALINSIVRALV
ncbi:MAG: RyR domain-containing protein [Hyphomonas sp.]